MLTCRNLHRTYRAARGEVRALVDVSLHLPRGEFLVIQGASGSGKSTLLLTLGGMLRPSAGTVVFDGCELYVLPPDIRTHLRSTAIGFVFQLFHLVPYLTVFENIFAGLPDDLRAGGKALAEASLEKVGLGARRDQLPGTLSAGERQRVALARALVKAPTLILADEPTGNLDPENAATVFRHLAEFQRGGGTVVVVTHGTDAAPYATRTLRLEQGRASEIPTRSTLAKTS